MPTTRVLLSAIVEISSQDLYGTTQAYGYTVVMEYDIDLTDDRPEGEREAFILWSTDCNRKMRCVSERLNKPIRNLYIWQKHFQWKVEADEDLATAITLMQDRGKEGFAELLSKAAIRLGKMLDDDTADHREQRENIRLLSLVANMAPQEGPNTLIDARSITLGANAPRNPQSALKQATGILEANVASTNNERRRGSRKTF
jgi:hypothetical protein